MNQPDLKQLIEKSRLNEEQKELFNDVFSALIKEHNKVIENIKQDIVNEKKQEQAIPSIYTLLVPRTEVHSLNKVGFEEVVPYKDLLSYAAVYDEAVSDLETNISRGQAQSGYYDTAFLMCKYSEVEGYLNQTYQGVIQDKNGEEHQITYCLYFNPLVLEAEKELIKLSEQYCFKAPVLYSPLGRRMVDIYINKVELKEWTNVDLKLEANGLEKVLKTDHTLMWNVKAEVIETSRKIRKPYKGQEKFYHQFDMEEGAYLFCKEKVDEISLVDMRMEIIAEEYIPEFKKISFQVVDEELIPQEFFSNKIKQHYLDKFKLRTKSDIRYVINIFENPQLNFELEDISMNPENKVKINRYTKQHSYYATNYAYFGAKNRGMVYLSFSGDVDNIYFEDYANYILANLSFEYPEHTWVGVYA